MSVTLTCPGCCNSCGCHPIADPLYVTGTHTGTLVSIAPYSWQGTVTGTTCNFDVVVDCVGSTGTCADYVVSLIVPPPSNCTITFPPPPPCTCSPLVLYFKCGTLTFPGCAGTAVDIAISA